MPRPSSANAEKRNMYRLLVRKPEGKRPLGRPRRRWIDNVEIDLVGVGWIGLVWLRIGKSECSNEPLGYIKRWETTEWLHNLWALEWYSASQS
jgi:hypothetical protein